ncbi:uncharacterized protein LOC143196387 [Rhynchophorus ferrugineus]|uniref:CHK kinase-like domain-containing protein n=1 Tax=Rhynchophorus ferrugineus TaxID=354439 RepID=A0A834IIS6_RHYFE|nr:hypothetical protein GWI33_006669 [Rhynchophorus ferrugineus]
MAKTKVSDLEGLLRQSIAEDVQVVDEKTTLLTAPGEHYGSVMLALQVKIKRGNGELQELPLVAKLIPANEMLRKAFDIPVTFKKEVFAYTESIPALVELQREYNVPDEDLQSNLFPKCYGGRLSLDENKNATVDEDAVLIFENLKVQGYITEDRLKGFDLSAARVILKDLARFHATPIALRLLKPEVFKEKVLPSGVYNKGLEQLPEEIGQAFHNAILDGAREIPELEPYRERVEKLAADGIKNPWVFRENPSETWGTICHADFWVSNTMVLKNEKGETISNKIVDLQLNRFWSCCCDVVFFLYTSIINSVLEEHFDELLKLYHHHLIRNLSYYPIDLEPFSWENFLKELNEIAPSELYHVLVMLKPICTERGKVTNTLEEFQDTDWSRKDLLGPNHRRKLKDTVLSLIEREWM